MVPVFMLTLVLVIVLLVALFVYDARRARDAAEEEGSSADAASPAPPTPPTPTTPPTPPPGSPAREPAPAPSRPAVDAEQLAQHVRELRRAVDAELVGHDEAVDSILRQAGGRLSREAATRLLDGEDGGTDSAGGDTADLEEVGTGLEVAGEEAAPSVGDELPRDPEAPSDDDRRTDESDPAHGNDDDDDGEQR